MKYPFTLLMTGKEKRLVVHKEGNSKEGNSKEGNSKEGNSNNKRAEHAFLRQHRQLRQRGLH